MAMFNIQQHHFGDVKFNTTHCINILYLGTETLDNNSFVTPCGCTTKNYDQASKTLFVCLTMNDKPEKSAAVICNIPEGQEVISLTAKVSE